MNKQTKTMLLTITAAVAALPLAGYTQAQSAPKTAPAMTQPATQAQTENDTETNDSQDPAIQGSVALPNDQNGAENGTEIADAQEAAQYQGLAKITPAQAQAAALTAVPGTVTSVQLGNENGFLMYDVVIGNQEVIVDAGDGKVLYRGAVDSNENRSENDNETGESGNN